MVKARRSAEAGQLFVWEEGNAKPLRSLPSELAANSAGTPPHDLHASGPILADVYSLGVLLYQMLTGICPLRNATPIELWRALTPRPADREREDRAHVVLVAGSPVFVSGAPLAVLVAPAGDVRTGLVDRLQRLGCRVETFEDGRDALIYSLQHHCHVLVMSEAASGMDPWEACGVMKRYARFDATRMLVLVGSIENASPLAKAAGVTELVALPLDSDDFARRIRRLLE